MRTPAATDWIAKSPGKAAESLVVSSGLEGECSNMTVRVHSFDPISDATSRVLILGSMPGKASLRADQYYAHPQNAFWKILGGLFDFDPAIPYESRLTYVREHGIALWDVMRSCVRKTSLDSDIEETSIIPNPFEDFLAAHSAIRTICFNGAKAEASWRKHVLPTLPQAGNIAYHRLPSTSPANASIRYDAKVDAWRVALGDTPPSPARNRP